MSRFGKTSILLPAGIEITTDEKKIYVKGPKGKLDCDLIAGIKIKVADGKAVVEKTEELSSAKHGLYRALLGNMVEGVSKGFEKQLTMIGVGYKAAVQGKKLDLSIGSSHPVQVSIPEDIKVVVDKNVNIIITGINKQKVGQFAATVRSTKPPEPYKGKGIRYTNEYVRKKEGKAAKAKTAAG